MNAETFPMETEETPSFTSDVTWLAVAFAIVGLLSGLAYVELARFYPGCSMLPFAILPLLVFAVIPLRSLAPTLGITGLVIIGLPVIVLVGLLGLVVSIEASSAAHKGRLAGLSASVPSASSAEIAMAAEYLKATEAYLQDMRGADHPSHARLLACEAREPALRTAVGHEAIAIRNRLLTCAHP